MGRKDNPGRVKEATPEVNTGLYSRNRLSGVVVTNSEGEIGQRSAKLIYVAKFAKLCIKYY